ncbi:MAG: hypothetical protein ACI4LX_06270 [Treponema sp.]
MEIKKTCRFYTFRFFLTLACTLFIFAGQNLFCQTKEFRQKLMWEAEPNALEYKIEIQNVDDDSDFRTIETENTFIEFSMPAGDYIYRVFAYDFLGREASVTEWKSFSILKAVKPEISVTDKTVRIKPSENKPVEIPVNIENITSESSAVVVNEETGETLDGQINISDKGDGFISGSVFVAGLTEGVWKVVVQNPSGLSSESESLKAAPAGKNLIVSKNDEAPHDEPVTETTEEIAEAADDEMQAEEIAETEEISEREEPVEIASSDEEEEKEPEEKPPEEQPKTEVAEVPEKKRGYTVQDINIMAGGFIPFIFYDEYLKSFDGSDFNWGLCAKISYLPIDIKKVQIGFELGASVTRISMQNDYIKVMLPVMIAQFNIVGRINLYKEKFGVNIKLGGGAAVFKKEIAYNSTVRENPADSWHGNICANGGLSVNWIPFKHLILEAGADFTHIFIPEMNSGILSAYLCVGLRF